jgi:hypothetical protein
MLDTLKAKAAAAKVNVKAAAKLKWEQTKIKEKRQKLKLLQKAAKDNNDLTSPASKVARALDDYSDAVDDCYKKVRTVPLTTATKLQCEHFVRAFKKDMVIIKKAHALYKKAKRDAFTRLEDSDPTGVLNDIWVWLMDDHQIFKQLVGIVDGIRSMRRKKTSAPSDWKRILPR